MELPFGCPACRTELERHDATLHCRQCAAEYPVRGDIPDFSTRDHYWSQLSRDQTQVLLEMAKTRGYREAVEKIIGCFVDKYLVGYVLDENRADFRSVLPITPSTSVLDLGGGWGAVSCSLAHSCRSVTVADTNPDTLRFIQIRAAQSGLGNVRPVRIDPLDDARLPFPDDSFDVAIMNGVLEYVGTATDAGSPKDVQLRCLAEIRRVLKPGGMLYVGIENRYAYLYFTGSPDHSGLRYTSLLPRSLANLVMRLRKGKAYRTYTYSFAGYRGLIGAAGFKHPDFYLAIPTYREPRFIVPAEDQRALLYFAQRHLAHVKQSTRRWLLETAFNRLPHRLFCALLRQTACSYLIVAEPQK